ncbi:allophanate hydrolase [Gorillibacterium sp. sgz5001074]|uniref:allophanate hydrolase n=1 Tax=Gorillibacterium sp. sgz5001074 TaxID=3446695 RepID=UPI003F6620F0
MSKPIPESLTVEGLRSLYLERVLNPREVMEEVVRRAERDAGMNIWITPPAMERLAPYLERLEQSGPESLPLWGIPFAVKDNIDVAGLPTTAACPDYAYEPTVHAAVVERLIAAGAIPIGKTNLDQFATGLVGTRSPYGETHNALRPELISGGSSSGSAVSVARGQAAFALGTDTAGSGRVPAALNGLVGYKPSLGAWPTRGVVPACASLDCVTVFAHSLNDACAVDAAARGAHPEDPWSRHVAVPSGSKRPSKLCLPLQAPEFFGPYASEYSAAWAKTVERLAGLGLPVHYVDTGLFSEAAAILYEGPWVAERWADLGGFIESHPGAAFPVTERVLRSGASPDYDAASVFRAIHRLQALKLEARKLLEDAVLVLPTAGGTWTREQVREQPVEANRDMGRYTNHCNLLDQCAVAVPACDAADRVPFGITFFASWEREDLIRGAAAWFSASGEPEGAFPAAAEASAAVAKESLEAPVTLVAVCGLHMRGYPLEKQMQACGARFVEEAESAPKYRFVKLPTTPAKPGMIKAARGGGAVRLELWEMPLAAFGGFAASIPAPLGIGKVELADGREVPGFICEGYAEEGAEDITALGSWRSVHN